MNEQPTTDNTEIVTAAVRIQTVTVNGKSMTQNIFRQLIEQSVINKAGGINGTPWGVVNYHPERCDDAKPHLHVVWQLGDQLRRSNVREPERAYMEHVLAGEYAMARIAEGHTKSYDSNIRVYRDTGGGGQIKARITVRGVSFIGVTDGSFLNSWDHHGNADQHNRDHLIRHYEETHGAPLRPSAEIADLLPVEAYKASWRALNELPQLFIGR